MKIVVIDYIVICEIDHNSGSDLGILHITEQILHNYSR